MDTKSFIREQLDASMKHVLQKFEELEEFGTTFSTSNGGCHPLWILGHLALTEGDIIRGMMLGEANPLAELEELFKNGAELHTDASRYPSHVELLEMCRTARADTIALLDSYSDSDLDTPSNMTPPNAEDLFRTRAHCFQFVSNHWWMHRAHLTDAKRMAEAVEVS